MIKLAKRISGEEKLVMVKSFTEGKTVDELAQEFDCTKSTITRNLKLNLGSEKYKELINKKKANNKSSNNVQKNISVNNQGNLTNNSSQNIYDEFQSFNTFTEITPLEFDVENTVQKDLSSVPISDVDFPSIVYMVVDKNIELEIKFLNEYPEWQFLPQEELNRKTIEIHHDIKIAKRCCNKEQKVIKVPNTNVFKIVAPVLLNKGISRIISAEKLIAL